MIALESTRSCAILYFGSYLSPNTWQLPQTTAQTYPLLGRIAFGTEDT